jgi:Isocitrate/isopropylmalate dehydrogenase
VYQNLAIMSKKTAVIKGDGIGPEVVDSMLRVLKECNFQSELFV